MSCFDINDKSKNKYSLWEKLQYFMTHISKKEEIR